MAQHGALSLVIELPKGAKETLRQKFVAMETAGIDTNPLVPFAQLTSIHFARFVVFDEGKDAYGQAFPARLVFTTNYDLPFDQHLNQLIEKAGPGLWSIFSMCTGFPPGDYTSEALRQYLLAQAVKTETFYAGVGPRTVSQIRNESELREAIEDYADQQQNYFEGKDPVFIRDKIIGFVMGNPSLAWARTPAPRPSFGTNFVFYGKLALVILLFIGLLPLVLPFLLVWMTLIWINEITQKDFVCTIDKTHLRTLVNRETMVVQSQFSAMGNVKPGAVRKATMLFMLRLTDFLAPYLFSKGKLSGIPTVHFARWLIVNGGKQMIFLSNFDGNSENYLRDFINIAGRQLTLMFCHTVGYPKTRLMYFGGAKDAEGFMAWARSFQVVTDVWYSANKNVTVKNIYHNAAIRAGLYGNMNPKQARAWLNKI